MRTGASARPTDARKSAVRAATCAGVPMLRLNRMKPQGSASRKKARSSGVSSGPEQPTMKAVVIVRAYDRAAARSRIVPRRFLSPIRFPCSPEWWRGDEALQAEAQAPQAPREQGDQAAGNVPALRPRSLFQEGVRLATAPHMRLAPPKKGAKDSPGGSRSSR